MRVADDPRPAVGADEVLVVHRRHGVGDGADDGVADEVGEADLALAAAAAVPVDHLAVDLEQLGGDVAEARRRRDGEALLHVGGDHQPGTEDQLALVDVGRRLGRARRGGGCCGDARGRLRRVGRRRRPSAASPGPQRRVPRRRRSSRCGRGGAGAAGAASEWYSEKNSCQVSLDRGGILAIALVHLVDEPGVRTEVRARVVGRSHRHRWYFSRPARPRADVARDQGREGWRGHHPEVTCISEAATC